MIRSMSLRLPVTAVALIACLALSAFLAGCGGGAGSPFGTIEVHNSSFSFEVIDAVRIIDEFDGSQVFLDTFIVPGDSIFVDGLEPGQYTVILDWTDGVRDQFFGVNVFAGATTTVTGQN